MIMDYNFASDVLPGEMGLQKLCEWAIKMGFSTGHADTVDDLLEELTWQIEELRKGAAAY